MTIVKLNHSYRQTQVIYAIGTLLLSLLIGLDIVYFKGILSAVLGGSAALFILAYYVPEFPFVVIVAGKSLWEIIGRFLPIAGNATFLAMAMALVVVLVQVCFHDKKLVKLKPLPVDLAILCFTIWIWLSLLWTPNAGYGLFKSLGFLAFSTTSYFLLRWMYDSRYFSIKRLSILILIAGVGHSLMAFYAAALSGGWRPGVKGMRYYILMGQWDRSPIYEADLLTVSIVATLLLLMLSNRRYRLILLGLMFLQVWAFMGYQQRGATFALLSGCGLIFLLSQKNGLEISRSTFRRLGAIIPIMVVILFLFIWFNPQLGARYLQTDINVLARFYLFGIGWQAFLDSPFWGVGIGGVAQTIAIQAAGDQTERLYVHNHILEIASELGMIGLLLAANMTYGLWNRARILFALNPQQPLRQLGALVVACLAGRYVVGMSSGDLAGWSIGVWAGLLVAVSCTVESEFLADKERKKSGKLKTGLNSLLSFKQ